MKNQKGISSLIGIIIIVAVAVAAVGSIFAYQYYSMPKEVIKNPVIEIPNTETPKIEAPKNETASWKTYRNDEYGFEFKYPESLSSEPPLISSERECKKSEYELYPQFNLLSLGRIIGDNIFISVICEKITEGNIKQPESTNDTFILKKGSIKLNGRDTYQYAESFDRTSVGLGGIDVNNKIIILFNDYALKINFSGQFIDKNSQILDESGNLTELGQNILSTFKFTK